LRPKFRGRAPQKRNPNRINEEIRIPKVRLVGDTVEPQIIETEKALALAKEQELDLVEISPNAEPPVCKIIDYQKFLYDQKKKKKEIKSKASKTVLKEIRFTPNTDDHDFEFKAKHAEKFILDGAKVKAFVQFRGRNIIFKDRGELILLKLAQRLEEIAILEQMPKLEGRKMMAFLAPKAKGKK